MTGNTYAYDLAVVYRVYPKVSTPAIGLPFGGDKLHLTEMCLRSFRQSLGDLKVKVWVLLDGCPEEYAELFRRSFASRDLVLLPLPGIGNHATFKMQIKILLEQEDSEFVYFAEDDYFYLPDQFRLVLNFLKSHKDVDFVTPYDHLDCYTLPLHHQPKWMRVFDHHHWRTAASTCLTFLTRRRTLRATERVFSTYAEGNLDASLWLSLTKIGLFRPIDFIRFKATSWLLAEIVSRAWSFGWLQILFRRRYTLWVPVPGIATHMDIKALSPGFDWPAMMNHQRLSNVEIV